MMYWSVNSHIDTPETQFLYLVASATSDHLCGFAMRSVQSYQLYMAHILLINCPTVEPDATNIAMAEAFKVQK